MLSRFSMQVNEITTLFNTIDINGDGQISKKEMKKSLKSLPETQKNKIAFLIKDNGKLNKSAFNLIANADKKINKDDLLNYLTSTDEENNVVELTEEQQNSRNNILNILSSMDKRKDGKITRKEIKKAYKKAVKNNDANTQEYLENFMTTDKKGKKVVDKSTFKYIATTAVLKYKKSHGKLFAKKALRVYGSNISYLSKYTAKAASLNDFIKFDTDGDYDLSEEEMSNLNEYKNYFYTLDAKQNGNISEKDIIKAYKNAAEDSDTKEMLSSLVTVTSKNKIKINKENFRTLAQGKKYINSTDILAIKTDKCNFALTDAEVKTYLNKSKEFMLLDSNDNGKLTLKEIKKAAKNGSNSNLVKYLASIESSKDRKKIFKMMSGGKKFVSAEDIKPYDADNDGFLSSDEVKTMVKKFAQG